MDNCNSCLFVLQDQQEHVTDTFQPKLFKQINKPFITLGLIIYMEVYIIQLQAHTNVVYSGAIRNNDVL